MPHPASSSEFHSSPNPPRPTPPALPGAGIPSPGDEWDLRGILAMVRRRWLAAVGTAIATFSLIATSTLLTEPTFEGRFRLLVEPMSSDSLSGLDQEKPQSQDRLDYDTQIQVLQNPQLINEVAQDLQKTYPDINYATIVGGLQIIRLQQTKIIEVKYTGTNPTQIRLILEALSKAYLDYSASERQTNLRQGIQFIERQLPISQDKVNELQQDLQTLRQSNEFIDPESLSGQITGQITGLSQQQLEVDQQLAQARSRFSQLQGETGATAALKEAPAYQQLVSQLREVETQIATELTRFDEQSLTIRVLRERRNNLLPLLRQEAQRAVGVTLADAATQIETLEVQRQAIARQQAALDQKFQQLPVLSRQYTDLQRELQVATESLSRFLSARENLQIEASQKEIPWQVVEPPSQPNFPISPNITRNLVLGGLGSIALAIVAAWLLEQLDNTYRSPKEIRDKTNLPLLGNIPFQPQQLLVLETSELLPLNRPTRFLPVAESEEALSVLPQPPVALEEITPVSEFLEPWRVSYAKLQLATPNRTIRSIVVSSALPGDGKTTVAINLAQAAVAMGQRVLLVDANLRQPQIHLRLDLPKFTGLSNLLSENHALRNLIQQPDPQRSLFVIPGGDITTDPTMLLSSPRMQALMAALHKAFNLVIYDTPPLEGLADSSLVAQYVDGVVLVASLGKTNRAALGQAIDALKVSQIPTLGVVSNQTRRRI